MVSVQDMPPMLESILSELSWNSKLKLIEQYYPKTENSTISIHDLLYARPKKNSRRSLLEPYKSERKVGLKSGKIESDSYLDGRRQTPSGAVGLEAKSEAPTGDDDNSMKLKLFRLMYETVRDSDLKVKRAELIKTQYVNSTAFEVGYLLGDVNDKHNVMTDIAMTLKRLYMEWKPIEHINAYEQIANQAIEIGHLIDLSKTVHKRKEPVWK